APAQKRIIIVASIHKITGVQSTNTAEAQVAIRGRLLSAWVLRDARCQQREVREPSSIQRKIHDRALIQHKCEAARLGFDRPRLRRNRDTLMSSSDCEFEANVAGAP